MTNRTDDQQYDKQEMEGLNEDEIPTGRPSPGGKIRERREELGHSQEKVSEALYITVHYVKALENDEYDKLPGLTFVKGYLKSYARYLDMDVDDVVECYEQHIGARRPSGEAEQVRPVPNEEAREQRNQVIVVVVVLVVLVMLGWWFIDYAIAAPVSPSTEQRQAFSAEAVDLDKNLQVTSARVASLE